jgi:hypothetical protein
MKNTTLIITAVAIIVALVFIGRMYLSEADFSLDNPYWNGASGLSSANVKPLYAISDLSGVGATDTLLIMSPERDYTADESAKVAAFLRGGGKVVVMDDFGNASSLLDSINSPITINPVPLCEYDNYYINHSFPIVNNIIPSGYTANVSELVFNHPVSLNLSSDAYPLASTAETGWLDVNDNYRMDGSERLGSYSVVAMANYGSGELLVIGDPDIFINSMTDKGDNKIFMDNVLKGVVWMDVSHGRDVSPAGVVFYILKYDPGVQAALVVLVFALGLVYVKRRNIAEWIRKLVVREPGNG